MRVFRPIGTKVTPDTSIWSGHWSIHLVSLSVTANVLVSCPAMTMK